MVNSVKGGTAVVRPRATSCTTLVVAIVLSATAFPGTSTAQISASRRHQNIAPVYEGWEVNPDGSFNLVFGYFNRNWEEIDVPIGPNNAIEPGGPDQGQPTHFYPQRTRFLFRFRVPKDFGTKEFVWTLVTHGKTERAYGTLHPDYFIDDGVLQANTGGPLTGDKNVAPVLTVEGDQTRHVKVGSPVTLTARAGDDGIPTPSPMPPIGARVAGVPHNAEGLRFSWFVYRGAGTVTFDPPQFSAWENLRDGRNSPYSLGWDTPPVPADGTWVVRTTFGEPGTYLLRALAHDGGLSTSADVTFVVNR